MASLLITLFGDSTHLHFNPSSKISVGGPQGAAGLTGSKIVIGTYACDDLPCQRGSARVAREFDNNLGRSQTSPDRSSRVGPMLTSATIPKARRARLQMLTLGPRQMKAL